MRSPRKEKYESRKEGGRWQKKRKEKGEQERETDTETETDRQTERDRQRERERERERLSHFCRVEDKEGERSTI